jgi:spore coat protein U-like protein
MMQRIALAVLLIVACGTLSAAAQGTCTLTITTLNFGTYTGVPLNGTASGVVTCAGGWDIPMYTGMGVGATETVRKMTSLGGAELSYELFTNASRTNNWGDTTGNELTGTGSTNITVYGKILANQTVAPGTYTDTMTTATTSFTVTVFISASCTISATTLGFGNYSGALINANSTLTVNCTNKTVFDIGLNAGTSRGATVTTRKMTGPASATLSYSMFRDSAHTLNWGDTVSTDTVQKTGTGSAVQYSVYGQLPAGQFVTPGTYTDTIVATVTY